LTVYNEPMPQPAEPEGLDVEGVKRGIYELKHSDVDGPRVQLLSSGVGVPWVLEAQELLAKDWGVAGDVWSVTSWSELRRDGLNAEQDAFLHPGEPARTPFLTERLQASEGPIVAVSDFAHSVPDQIREFVPRTYATLGADGFGFSDTRAAARRYFHIDGPSVVVRALELLADEGKVDAGVPAEAFRKYRLDDVNAGTTGTAGGES
ncbi:MAG TPA: pyruvate dehydrogenase (acetyl-transferring), homodimeric type, partial [Amnibacterium sp.]|nr:pyruvate dehydrogenase (acetyl-transferring), homodimeric type [Amnibacterium sp.]